MEMWENWRGEYADYLEKSKSTGNNEDILGIETLRKLTPKLNEAQAKCATINEKRRKLFYTSFCLAGVLSIFVAIEAFLNLLLYLQGV